MFTILVADANANHAALVEQELSDEGYRVVVARNDAEALNLIERQPPDLIVTDLARQFGFIGSSPLQNHWAHGARIPVIVHSAYADGETRFQQSGADAFVLKAIDLSELKMMIELLLARRGIERQQYDFTKLGGSLRELIFV